MVSLEGRSCLGIMRRLLTPLWLRPESALWYAHMLHTAALFWDHRPPGETLEFGCMDGVNAAILLGAAFDPSFDVYEEVVWDRGSHERSTIRDDYFNTFRSGLPDISFQVPPSGRFDAGVDWKEAHLVKARRTGVYRNLRLLDPSAPLLPFPGGSFAAIWAPNIYWMPELGQVLRELSRVLAPGGMLVTIGPDSAQLEMMFARFADCADARWLQDLDRGRFGNVQRQARSLDGWTATFAEAGLAVKENVMFIPRPVAEVYDIGLRPMFPVLMNMYQKLKEADPAGWLDVKQHWIEAALHFLGPLCDAVWDRDMPRGWHCFCLRRASA